ncbi:hypothetical protein E4U25_006465 [Claviceps purpurea]|nr:hypothetical protein E4U25_006465 [Claviceps purpurea]
MTHETLAIKAAETNLEHALFVLDDPVASAAVKFKQQLLGSKRYIEGKIHTLSRKIAASALIGNAASSAIGKSAEWWRY